MVKNCLFCNIEFDSNIKTKIFCNLKCYELFYKDKLKKYSSEYYEKNKILKSKNKNCLYCKKDFIDNTKFNRMKFCCLDCKRLNMNKRLRDKWVWKSKIFIDKICPCCNKKYSSNNKNQFYCSIDCQELSSSRKFKELHREKHRLEGLEYYQKNKLQKSKYAFEYIKKNKEKYNAHKIINADRKSNPNKYKSNCSICNSDYKINQHHEDYSKPYNVIALCKICHMAVHRKHENEKKIKCRELYYTKYLKKFINKK